MKGLDVALVNPGNLAASMAVLVFGDTSPAVNLGFMVDIGLDSDRLRLAGSTGRFPRSFTSFCSHL